MDIHLNHEKFGVEPHFSQTYHTLNSHIFDNWQIRFQMLQIYSLSVLPDQSVQVSCSSHSNSDILHKQATPHTDIVILLHLPIYYHPSKIHQFEIHTYQEGAT